MRLILSLAMRVGVPVVPGTPGPVNSYIEGEAFTNEHGFPGGWQSHGIVSSVV